jgi:hypothetical protein
MVQYIERKVGQWKSEDTGDDASRHVARKGGETGNDSDVVHNLFCRMQNYGESCMARERLSMEGVRAAHTGDRMTRVMHLLRPGGDDWMKP